MSLLNGMNNLSKILRNPIPYVRKSLFQNRSISNNDKLCAHSRSGKGRPGFLYAYVLNERRQIFKVGKSVDVDHRIRAYRTTDYDYNGFVYHKVACEDMDNSERILHNILKINGCCIKKEIFQVEKNLLKEYMEMVQTLCIKVKSIQDPSKLRKITRIMNEIK